MLKLLRLSKEFAPCWCVGDCCHIFGIGSCRHICRWKKTYFSKVVSTIDQQSPWWGGDEVERAKKKGVTIWEGKRFEGDYLPRESITRNQNMALSKESIEWNKIHVAGGLIGCVGGCILCTGSDAEKRVGVVVRGLKARHKYGLGSWCGRTPAENKWLVQHDEISDLLDKSWYSQWNITRIANAIPCHSLLVIF